MGELSKTVRIPLAVDYSIRGISTATGVVNEHYGLQNLVVHKDSLGPESRLIVQTRPTFKRQVANGTAKRKGRGVFTWGLTNTLYIVNDDTIYRTDYNTTVGTISSGHQRVYFTPVGSKLLINDPENGDLWTIDASHNLALVSDSDITTTNGIIDGALTLNGRAYVADVDGNIYNSALEDSTQWNSLDVINAEREPDGAVFIAKHHDHIVVLGLTTIEFFRDNANPSGSLLSRREDVFYNIGAIDGRSVWVAGDVIYFVGVQDKGSLAVYKLENFTVTKISDYGLDAFMADSVYVRSRPIWFTGFQARGNSYLILHTYAASGTFMLAPTWSLMYDSGSGFWSRIRTEMTNLQSTGGGRGPTVTDWSGQGGNLGTIAKGISGYGEILSIREDFQGSDTDGSTEFNTNYAIVTRHMDGGTSKYKYCRSIRLIGDAPQTADGTISNETFRIEWSDAGLGDGDFSGGGDGGQGRAIQIFGANDNTGVTALKRCGRFRRRAFRITGTFDQAIPRLEALELEVAIGDV